MSKRRLPQRIACLSTETVEVIYALGEQDRIAGISGFTVKPPQARKEKPKISGFSTAHLDKILAVAPDLVLAPTPTCRPTSAASWSAPGCRCTPSTSTLSTASWR